MEPRKKSTETIVGGKKYQLHKVDSRTACWLFSFLSSRADGNILSALGQCSKQEFSDLQNMALSHTFFLDEKDSNVFPTAVLAPASLNWADQNLEENPDYVFKITCEWILFNLQPFLVENKSKARENPQVGGNQ